MTSASQLSFMGIAQETTPGTAVPATAFIPVSAPSAKDALTLLPDKGLRGAMVDSYGEIAGTRSSTFDFSGDVFPDTFGWVVAGILGDVTTTGSTAPYTHEISTLNSGNGQPRSYTFTDYYSVAARQYRGAKFSEMGLKFSADGMLTYDAKTVAYGSATTTKPTASFTSIPPLAGWRGTVSLGGTPVSTVLDGELNLKRSATPIFPVDGSQDPSDIWVGPVSAEGKLTVVMANDDALNAYLDNTATSLTVDYSTGAGTDAVQVAFTCSHVIYSAAEIDRGKDFVTLSISYTADANTTDVGTSAGYSPVKFTLQNAVATGVYA